MRSSAVAVHDRLRAAILRGDLEAGAPLPQGALAEAFGAGRTPLREALRMLQREGLVISEPNRPVRIAPLSADDFEQIFIMRVAIEATAIHVTVPALSSSDIADLEGLLAQMRHYQRADDAAGFRVPHRAFHHRLTAGSGTRVSAQIDELSDHSERYRRRFIQSGRWEDSDAEHRGILDAATAGDATLAARRLAEHHAHTAALTLHMLDPDHDPTRLRATIAAVMGEREGHESCRAIAVQATDHEGSRP
jgi:DNA-binding GntR family transcriptional regulator